MRLDDFVLDFVSSLLLVFLFHGTSFFVDILGFSLDLNDALLRLAAYLLEQTYIARNRLVIRNQ